MKQGAGERKDEEGDEDEEKEFLRTVQEGQDEQDEEQEEGANSSSSGQRGEDGGARGGEQAEDRRPDDDGEAEEAVGEEDEALRVPRSPPVPSAAERARHEATHANYRSWCKSCVAGRGVESPHKSDARKKNQAAVPEVVLDFCFPSQGDDPTITVLGLKEQGERGNDSNGAAVER